VVNILKRVRDAALGVVEDIRAARNPAPPPEPTFVIKTPGLDEEIQLAQPKRFDKPLTPEQEFREAKRLAMDYARKRTGKPDLTWAQTKRLMDRWEKEERRAEADARRAQIENGKTIHFDGAQP
jgi:hypothetical protein